VKESTIGDQLNWVIIPIYLRSYPRRLPIDSVTLRSATFRKRGSTFTRGKKGKGPVIAIVLLTRVRLVSDQKPFTISEVAADWHELMIPQRTMRPSIARVGEQLDSRFAANRHTTAPISHNKLLLISRPA